MKDSEAVRLLVPTVIALSRDEERRRELQGNIGRLAVTDADEVIAAEILKTII